MIMPPEEKLRFIFITPCVDEGFFDPVKKGMRDAGEMTGVECAFTGTEDVDLETQVEMVKKAIADGYNGIALSIIDPVAFDNVIQEAIDKGIPVVAFNVDDRNTPNARLSAVCQDVYQAGRILGKEAIKLIPENSKILMTVHSEGISALEDRLRGIQEILIEKGITWKTVVTGTIPEKAGQIIARELETESSVKAVLCTGQADTEGAGLAIERHFKNKGYVVAGFDLSSEILRLVKDGMIKFTIDQQPYVQGFYPVIQLTLYCRYGIKPSNIDAGATIIRKENVENIMNLSKQHYR